MSDFGDKLPAWVHALAALIAHANSACNPMLYAIFNPMYLTAYKKFLNKITMKKYFNSNHQNQDNIQYTVNSIHTNQDKTLVMTLNLKSSRLNFNAVNTIQRKNSKPERECDGQSCKLKPYNLIQS
jgi:hypothetical protein